MAQDLIERSKVLFLYSRQVIHFQVWGGVQFHMSHKIFYYPPPHLPIPHGFTPHHLRQKVYDPPPHPHTQTKPFIHTLMIILPILRQADLSQIYETQLEHFSFFYVSSFLLMLTQESEAECSIKLLII